MTLAATCCGVTVDKGDYSLDANNKVFSCSMPMVDVDVGNEEGWTFSVGNKSTVCCGPGAKFLKPGVYSFCTCNGVTFRIDYNGDGV